MIETLPAQAAISDILVSERARAGFAALRAAIAGRSQIVWAEHCSECAYPTCYAACAFYTPRSDLHCRRFEAGIEPVAGTGGLGLHRIRFRQWGKLEGRGATAVAASDQVARRERRDERVARAVAAFPAPYAIKRKLAAGWNTSKEKTARRPGGLEADAFVVEAWAADGRSHPFTLTLLNVGGGAGQMFQARFEAGPDYQRLTVPIGDIRGRIDLKAPFLVQIEPIGEAAGRDVVFGVCDFVSFKAEPLAASAGADARPVKVVVWDLDETLWRGTLAEDGADGVRVRPEAEAAIKALDERGVLQSIASKNDAAEAMAALTKFGLADYFLHPQIHWDPKSQSIGRIARALDLGVDSFVFIDDQPFERAEVAAGHPRARLLADTDVGGLLDHPWFDLPVTVESRGRRAMYQAEALRSAAFESAPGEDYLRFLRQSDIRAEIRPLAAADAERVYELSQRTNQLNFRATKYGREAVQAMLTPDPDQLRLTVRCADRFGDYGLIGFVVVDLRQGEVTDFFMSCRVQRKRVEHALFAWIAREVQARGRDQLGVRFKTGARNGAARAMLGELGFTEAASGDNWRRDLAQPFEDADVVQVVAGDHAEAA